MRQLQLICYFLMCYCVICEAIKPLNAAETGKLATELEPLRPFLVSTWRGELNDGKGNSSIDVAKWQRALNGTAIHIVHSVNNGEYGGETMLFWDKKRQSLIYYYFTTAGFYTQGTMVYDTSNQQLIAEEVVNGDASGITKVRSTSKVTAGKLTTQAEYLQNGTWIKGHAAVYLEDAQATIQFK
jgi:hypothetical protein